MASGPRLFYWIERDRLAGGSCPVPSDLPWLRERGVDAVISLLDNPRQSAYDARDVPDGMAWHNVPLRDHATPRLGQLTVFYDTFWSLPRDARVYVHCYAGIGRTGTVAASYLVWQGQPVEAAMAQADAWTQGGFRREIRGREGEVRDLLRRFRDLFAPGSP